MLGLYQGGRSVVDNDSVEWRAENLSPAPGRHSGPNRPCSTRIDGLFPDRLSRPDRHSSCWQGARAPCNERRGGMINLSYGNGRTVRVPKGLSVLEASLRNNVPHASVCGGRARCSTCRIRVIGDCTSPAGAVAARGVRARPGRRGRIRRSASPASCGRRPISRSSSSSCRTRCPPMRTRPIPTRIGQERYLVSMFVDMRGSTKLAEKRLPFDTVFIVNRFLGAVSQAVIECGGQAEPVRRRRHAGAVRARDRPRKPPAARRCKAAAHDRRQCRRIESISRAMTCASRSASASASMAAK